MRNRDVKPRLSLSLKKANKARHSEDRELQVAKDITNTKPHITAGVQQNQFRDRFASPVSEITLKKSAIIVAYCCYNETIVVAYNTFQLSL